MSFTSAADLRAVSTVYHNLMGQVADAVRPISSRIDIRELPHAPHNEWVIVSRASENLDAIRGAHSLIDDNRVLLETSVPVSPAQAELMAHLAKTDLALTQVERSLTNNVWDQLDASVIKMLPKGHDSLGAARGDLMFDVDKIIRLATADKTAEIAATAESHAAQQLQQAAQQDRILNLLLDAAGK